MKSPFVGWTTTNATDLPTTPNLFFIHNTTRNALLQLIKEHGVQSFHFIYVDACHNGSHTLEDMVLSWQLLQVGGLMLIDDYTYFRQVPKEQWFEQRLGLVHGCFVPCHIAMDAFLECYKNQYDLIINNDQIGFIKKIDYN
jgi:hypothetical protein